MMIETWKQIEGYLGYEVSNFGNVRSHRNGINAAGNSGTLRAIRPSIVGSRQGSGYLHVVFCINYKKTGHYVHRLVAEAFIGKIQKGMTVNHINGNKLDNCLENLEIVSQRDNNLHAYAKLGKKSPKPEHLVRDPTTGRIIRVLKFVFVD